MSKKKAKVQKNAEEVKKPEAEVTDEKSEAEKEKVEQTPPTLEELLAIEKDKNLRLLAEFENFRKRTAKERIALFATAGQDIMAILLPILDDMERAIHANEYDEKHGIALQSARQFQQTYPRHHQSLSIHHVLLTRTQSHYNN